MCRRSPERRPMAGNEPMLSVGRVSALTIADCRLKDEIVTKYENIAREALAGQVEAEEREMMTKRELDQALEAKAAADERLSLVEAALVSSIEQLNDLEDEMEGRIRDAVVNGTTMFVERQVEFEEKLNEATTDFANLSLENSRLVAEISAKDKAIKDLDRRRCVAESELDELTTKLDGIEKENAFLRYEFHMMEKELAVRNEEVEYCSQSAEELHKKHQQGLKKVTKLEAECQRLRALSQKRVIQSAMMRMPDSRRRRVTERLQALEEENETLKEVILIKDSEVDKAFDGGTSDDQYAKAQRYESGPGKDCVSSESWANALLQELENFRKEGLELSLKPSLESDQLDVEKLVIVPLEVAPRPEGKSSSSLMKSSSFDWLQVVLDAITEQRRISERDFGDLLLDVGIALGFGDLRPDPRKMRKYDRSAKDNERDNQNVVGLLPWRALATVEVGNSDEIKTMETAKMELEERLKNARQEIFRMNEDAVRLKESNRLLEDQIENQRSINQDLETELAITRAELNEVAQKYYSLEVELEDQNHRCEELESICIEMELQLEGIATEPLGYCGAIQGPTMSGDDVEEQFTACPDAMTNTTKQPKTMPSPSEVSASGRAVSDRSSTNLASSQGYNNRPSLHERMLADGFAELKPVVVPRYTKIPSPRRDNALLTSVAAIRTRETRQANNTTRTTAGPAASTSPRKRIGGRGRFGFVRKLLIKNSVGRTTIDVSDT